MASQGGRRFRLPEDGFGLIENLVAIAILVAAFVPVAYLLTNVFNQTAFSRQKITALSLAEQWIETLNYQGPPMDQNNQPDVGHWITENPGGTQLSGTTYDVAALFTWASAGNGSTPAPDLCTSGIAPVLELQVKVTWAQNQSLTDTSLLGFPPSGVLTNGFLAIQVDGDPAYPGVPQTDVYGATWAQRVTSVPITVSGSNLATPYQLNPASNGCAFLELAPGVYTVTVGPGPSSAYVANFDLASSQTQASGSQAPITVNTAAITRVVFQYDEGTTVGLAYPATTVTDDGVVCPNSSGSLTCIVLGQTAAGANPAAAPVATGLVEGSGCSGWCVASLPSTLERIESVGCATGAAHVCVAVGYSTASSAAASVAQPGSVTTWTASTLPSGWSALSQITCVAATAPACFAIGSGTNAGKLALATISGSAAPYGITWTAVAPSGEPGGTALTQVVCPATSTCYAIGNTASAGVLVTGAATWSNVKLPTTPTSLNQIVCVTASACVVAGTRSGSPVVESLSGTTWSNDTLPSGVTAVTQVSCPGTTTPATCYAIGSTSSGAIVMTLGLGSSTTWSRAALPSGIAALSQIVCPSASSCVAVGSTASGPVTVSLKGSWTVDTLPAGLAIASIGPVVCPGTTLCLAPVSTTASAAVISLNVGSSTTWTNMALPGAPVFFSAISCTSTSVCEAAGASETGPLVYDDTSGTFSPAKLPGVVFAEGLYLDNPPILVSNSNQQPSPTLEALAPTTTSGPATQVGPLFPFVSASSVAVGSCAADATTASAPVTTVPGATPGLPPPNQAPTVTLPMGLLALEVVHNGVPLVGASVSIAETCPGSSPLTPLGPGSNPSNPSSYAMPTTGPDGETRLAVIYGTFTVTVAGYATTHTVTVRPTSVVLDGTTTVALPNPVVVSV